jgi:putative protease
MGISVLEAGADLVFVGLQGFSRRGFECELTVEDIAFLCSVAGKMGKSVRLAVNIYPDDKLSNKLEKDVATCVEAGVSAFIVNDPGLCKYLRCIYPNIGIHVSVGASTLNIFDVHFWQSIGATGLVLLCDLGPREIQVISEKAEVELEILVHANLDFTYLGKCWISSYSSTRNVLCQGLKKVEGSPNRGGICYRVCRRRWHVADGDCEKGGSSDLPNECRLLAGELRDYLNAGVTCFKIQGREYSIPLVVEMVRTYRWLLDNIMNGDSIDEYLLNERIKVLEDHRDAERSKRTNTLVDAAIERDQEATVSTKTGAFNACVGG